MALFCSALFCSACKTVTTLSPSRRLVSSSHRLVAGVQAPRWCSLLPTPYRRSSRWGLLLRAGWWARPGSGKYSGRVEIDWISLTVAFKALTLALVAASILAALAALAALGGLLVSIRRRRGWQSSGVAWNRTSVHGARRTGRLICRAERGGEGRRGGGFRCRLYSVL